MVSENDDDLDQRRLDHEVTWCTRLDERPRHESFQPFDRTREFDYEAWHNSQNKIISTYAERKGYTAYDPTYVTATVTCRKKNRGQKV